MTENTDAMASLVLQNSQLRDSKKKLRRRLDGITTERDQLLRKQARSGDMITRDHLTMSNERHSDVRAALVQCLEEKEERILKLINGELSQEKDLRMKITFHIRTIEQLKNELAKRGAIVFYDRRGQFSGVRDYDWNEPASVTAMGVTCSSARTT